MIVPLDDHCCMQGNCAFISGIITMLTMPADGSTDVAAELLCMLYISDLRGLQTSVDDTVVNVRVSSNIDSHVLSTKAPNSFDLEARMLLQLLETEIKQFLYMLPI